MKFKMNALGIALILGLSTMTASASGLQKVTANYVSSNYAKPKNLFFFNPVCFVFTALEPPSPVSFHLLRRPPRGML